MEDQQPQELQQQQQQQQELAKLRAIEAKVKQVQDKLTTRLPHQHSHLAAMVCGTTWVNRVRLAKKKWIPRQEQYAQIVKKVRMELGTFDYQVKEQGELLTRYLCELDNILSFGNAEVKDARKALVVFIQSLLTAADAFRTKSAKLKEFGDKLMSTLLKPEIQRAIEDAAPAAETQSITEDPEGSSEEQTPTSPTSEPEDVEMKPLFAEDDDDEEEEDGEEDDDSEMEADNQEGDGDDDDDDEDANEEMGDDEEEEESEDEEQQEEQQNVNASPSPAQRHTSPRQSPPQTQQQQQRKPHIDVRSLPVWRPYYQIQKRRDGLYLVANLRDVDPQNLRVQWIEHAGVLHISGHKLPSQKDIMVSRFSGVPTFGRFEIAERLPANMLNMDDATQKVGEDGTLEIRMPYYSVQHRPRLFRQRSLFETPRCMVW